MLYELLSIKVRYNMRGPNCKIMKDRGELTQSKVRKRDFQNILELLKVPLFRGKVIL